MQRSGWLRAFEQVIGEQIAAVCVLESRLEDEARVLLERDLDGLDAVTAAKQSCIDTLERAEAERRSLMAVATDGTPAEALDQRLVRVDPTGRAIALWRELTARLETCRLRNAHNGRLVAMRRVQVLRALSLLGGTDAGGLTYGRLGIAGASLPQRDLARA